MPAGEQDVLPEATVEVVAAGADVEPVVVCGAGEEVTTVAADQGVRDHVFHTSTCEDETSTPASCRRALQGSPAVSPHPERKNDASLSPPGAACN